jgi:hypothetical protein
LVETLQGIGSFCRLLESSRRGIGRLQLRRIGIKNKAESKWLEKFRRAEKKNK